ncbi:putative membrane protein YhhN [Microbacterium trichothecenolyticum]|uniref:lysoplasmalogenase n=1 Tax=Microbacterium trichothecenolyticum TaxID=69370 RepID=UPI00285A48EA|nr:lysoplasmalogenase [Microbacterium trichothecenolyticum]MDR7113261.1 putative membrane protein YhhN [Microbacterium trichothecenolyticum]
MRRLWIGFVPYIAVSIVHVAALAVGSDAVAAPTKLALMPLLGLAVVWGAWGSRWTPTHTLLVVALVLSWLGDGAGTFVPWLPTVPMMLLFFGLAHLCYIWLFWRKLAVRRAPLWAAVYAVWWVVLLAVLWPHLGGLAIAVAIYGLVLGGTAFAASRCHPLIVWGGVFFLTSDSVLAFRLFTPDAMPDWTSPLVMLTYCLGQGLIAAGVLVSVRARNAVETQVATR